MVLPIWVIRGLQMSLGQKLGLSALFMMAVVDIAVDICRRIETLHGRPVRSNLLLNVAEPAIAVMISALLPYRKLFIGQKQRKWVFGEAFENENRKHPPQINRRANLEDGIELKNSITHILQARSGQSDV